MPNAICDAAHAVYQHFIDQSNPFAGFFVNVGERDDSIVVFCRYMPTDRQKQECVDLCGDVPVDFIVTGDFRPLGG